MKNIAGPIEKTGLIIVNVLTLILLLVILNTCKKDEGENTYNDNSEVLSSAEIAFFDQIPSSNFTANTILLPDGSKLSDFLEEFDPELYRAIYQLKSAAIKSVRNIKLEPFLQKNLFIARMLANGLVLTNRNMYNYPDEGPDAPAQHGLAYSFGQKDHTKRRPPPAKSTICYQSIYGLDCSGLVYQIAKRSGVNLSSNPAGECKAAFESDTLNWGKAFKSSSEFQDLRMEDLGKLAVDKILPGDLIFWLDEEKEAYHVGVTLYASQSTGVAVYMSCGCGTSCNEQGCLDNLSETRGPRQIILGDPKWFNKEYKVLRIKNSLFPFKSVQFCISSPAKYSDNGKEVTGNFSIINTFKINMQGSKITGRFEDKNSGIFIDSLEITLDTEEFEITDFRFTRNVQYPTVGNYTHYEKARILKRGVPIKGVFEYYSGEITMMVFMVKGVSVPDFVNVNFEFNTRKQYGAGWVIANEKIMNLIADQTSFISFYFVR